MTSTPVNPRRRKPTGEISWPIILLAGGYKAGKSFAAIKASGSDMIGQTFYLAVGETDVDELAHVPGARFEEFEHDGTMRDITTAFAEASAEPQIGDKPNLLIIDSSTPLWDLVQSEQQVIANERRLRRQQRQGGGNDARQRGNNSADLDNAKIEFDQWKDIHRRFGRIIEIAQKHNGPVIITARLDEVTVVDAAGKPTRDKQWSIKTSGKLPYEVQGIIEMPRFGEGAWLRGVRSPVMAIRGWKPTDANKLPDDWDFDWLWTQYGIGDPQYTIKARRVTPLDPDAYANKAVNLSAAAQEIATAALAATSTAEIVRLRADAEDLDVMGMTIVAGDRQGVLHQLLAARAAQIVAGPPAQPVHAQQPADVHAQVPADMHAQQPAPTPAPMHAPAPVHVPEPAPMPAHPDTEPPADWDQGGYDESLHGAPPEPEIPAAPAPAVPTAAPATVPAGVLTEAPAGETKSQRAERWFREEHAYQAGALGMEPAEYAKTTSASPDPNTPGIVLSEDGNLDGVKAHRFARFLVQQRPVVVEALRAQGRVSEAEVYESTGLKTPVDLAALFGKVDVPVG